MFGIHGLSASTRPFDPPRMPNIAQFVMGLPKYKVQIEKAFNE